MVKAFAAKPDHLSACHCVIYTRCKLFLVLEVSLGKRCLAGALFALCSSLDVIGPYYPMFS